jgi:arylsulfatase A-like enzyme
VKHLITFIITLLLGSLATDSMTAAERPNVLFIAVDDLNDWIGCLNGHPQALTPNMDRLAARGVLFANAHCTAPACNPSRAAVFSGRLPQVTGVWSNQSGSLQRLPPDAVLLPKAFSKAGYQTLGTGKLLHSGGEAAFDEYFSVNQRWSPFSKKAVEYTKKELPSKRTDNPRHLVKDSRGREIVLPLNRMPSDRRPDRRDGESFDWGPFDVPDSDFGDTQITAWAIEKIKQARDKPFFLGVGYYRPHIPLWAPKRFFDRFANSPGQLPRVKPDDLDDLSEAAKKWALEPVTAGSHETVVKHKQWRSAVEAYLACVTYVDHEIGRLLDALDNSSVSDNTVIVLWSDHGWHLGEKQHWGKWTGWERSTKVPLIIVPPTEQANRFAAGGSRCDQPVGLLDLYPTLAELCRVDAPDELDGESLVPLLSDPSQSTGRGVVTMFDPGNASLRTDRWRYIHYADGSEELYDLQQDADEWENLAGAEEHARQKASLHQVLSPFLLKTDSR